MGSYYSIGAKELGFILIALALVLALVFVSTTREMMDVADSACECSADDDAATCPHSSGFPLQSYLGFTLVFVLGGIGVYMSLSGMKYKEALTEKESRLEKVVAKLEGDEKKLCELIKDDGGAVFQSELVEKTGLSKVKVTRTLDKLEGKGIIERRRRGMTNLVLLK